MLTINDNVAVVHANTREELLDSFKNVKGVKQARVYDANLGYFVDQLTVRIKKDGRVLPLNIIFDNSLDCPCVNLVTPVLILEGLGKDKIMGHELRFNEIHFNSINAGYVECVRTSSYLSANPSLKIDAVLKAEVLNARNVYAWTVELLGNKLRPSLKTKNDGTRIALNDAADVEAMMCGNLVSDGNLKLFRLMTAGSVCLKEYTADGKKYSAMINAESVLVPQDVPQFFSPAQTKNESGRETVITKFEKLPRGKGERLKLESTALYDILGTNIGYYFENIWEGTKVFLKNNPEYLKSELRKASKPEGKKSEEMKLA